MIDIICNVWQLIDQYTYHAANSIYSVHYTLSVEIVVIWETIILVYQNEVYMGRIHCIYATFLSLEDGDISVPNFCTDIHHMPCFAGLTTCEFQIQMWLVK